MGAVVSCFKTVVRAIGNVIMTIVRAIGAIIMAIVNGVVAVIDAIIGLLTCNFSGRRRHKLGGGHHRTARV